MTSAEIARKYSENILLAMQNHEYETKGSGKKKKHIIRTTQPSEIEITAFNTDDMFLAFIEQIILQTETEHGSIPSPS